MNHGLTVVAVLRKPMLIPRFVWLAVWFLPHGPCSRSLQMAYAAIGHYSDVTGVQESEHVRGVWSDAREVYVVWNEKHRLPATLTAYRNPYKIPWKKFFLGKQIATQLLGNSPRCMESNLPFCLHKNPQLDPVLNLINPVHVRTYFF